MVSRAPICRDVWRREGRSKARRWPQPYVSPLRELGAARRFRMADRLQHQRHIISRLVHSIPNVLIPAGSGDIYECARHVVSV